MTSYTYKNQSIEFQLTLKKRKTQGIYLDAYGNIELRVPRNTTDQQIKDLLEAKWSWIIEKQAEMRERTKGFKEKTYEDEEEFMYLGKTYPIKVVIESDLSRPKVSFVEDYLEIVISEQDPEVIKKALTRYYKQQCKALVEGRIRHYQPNFKMKPKSIKISSNKKHWGSCTSLRALTFNWKLAMAPLEVLDYVVIHEMCHMVHMNHDRSFWRLVGKYMPDYESKQAWLQQSHWKMVV